MTVNERIKWFRKNHLHMSQAEFSQIIGMKQTSVSTFERIGASVSEQIIKSICMAFSVNEEWLRTGKGEMLKPSDKFDLDQYLKEKGCTALEMEIIKTYLELDANTRRKVFDHFHSRLEAAKANLAMDSAQPRLAVVESPTQSERAEWEQEAQEFAKMAYYQFLQEKKRESQASFAQESETG